MVTGEAAGLPRADNAGAPAAPIDATIGAIRPIHARGGLSRGAGAAFLHSRAFTAAVIVPPLAWGLLLGLGRVRSRLSGDEQRNRRRRLRSLVRRRLRQAEAHRTAGRVAAFYAEIDRVLREAVAERLAEPVAGLQLDELRRRLAARGFEAAQAEGLIQVLMTCDEARFAPGAGTADPAALAATEARAAELVAAVERAPLRGEGHA